MASLPTESCYGCWSCFNICPVDAVSMPENDEGFHYPSVDQSKCTLCGNCRKGCPALYPPRILKRHVNPVTWAAWSHDSEERKMSSSGGVFSVLAKHALACGGVVFGAGFDKDWELEHLSIERLGDLHRLRGSKYLQSKIGNVYKKTKAFLKEKRPVLFSGTPCQIAGLYGYLGHKEFAELITCEIICHGVPSPKLFRKYRKEIEKSLDGHIKKINFRDKHHGWKNYSLTFDVSNTLKLVKCYRIDDYMCLFLSNICLRKCCSTCEFARTPRVADITLGDYWNISYAHPDLPNDDLGVSVVICNSSRGDNYLEKIKHNLFLTPSTFAKAVAGNKNLVTSSVEHKKRGKFFSLMDKNSVASLRFKFCKKNNIILRICLKLYRSVRQMLAKN